jgi:hypothetical protein
MSWAGVFLGKDKLVRCILGVPSEGFVTGRAAQVGHDVSWSFMRWRFTRAGMLHFFSELSVLASHINRQRIHLHPFLLIFKYFHNFQPANF